MDPMNGEKKKNEKRFLSGERTDNPRETEDSGRTLRMIEKKAVVKQIVLILK